MHPTPIQCVFIIFNYIFIGILAVNIKEIRTTNSKHLHSVTKTTSFSWPCLFFFLPGNVYFAACVATDRKIKPETFSLMASLSEEHLNIINIEPQITKSAQMWSSWMQRALVFRRAGSRRCWGCLCVSLTMQSLPLWWVFVSQHKEFGFNAVKQKWERSLWLAVQGYRQR